MTEDTRKSILEATLSIVGEGGFGGLTVRAIAERAGVAIGTVNYHFGSKDNAVSEAYRFVTADLVAAFAALRDGLGLVHAAIRAIDPRASSEEAAMRMSQFAGALLYPELVHGAMGID